MIFDESASDQRTSESPTSVRQMTRAVTCIALMTVVHDDEMVSRGPQAGPLGRAMGWVGLGRVRECRKADIAVIGPSCGSIEGGIARMLLPAKVR